MAGAMPALSFVAFFLLTVWIFAPFIPYIASIAALVWFACTAFPAKIIEKPAGKPRRPVTYDMKKLVLPRLTGLPLRWFSRIVDSAFGYFVAIETFRKSNATLFRRLKMTDEPTYYPVVQMDESSDNYTVAEDCGKGESSGGQGFRFWSIEDFAEAYISGKMTPSVVADAVLSAIDESDKLDKPLRAFVQVDREEVRKMAEASSLRFSKGSPLSVIDGVPVTFKEEYGVIPYHLRAGTVFLGESPSTEDASVVKKIRDSGAVIIGVTNMNELGLGVTGSNPNKLHGTPRNPYHLDHYTGGSSSGSAAAVAAGLVPVAMGNDAAGSIRIPASLCGAVGLKATFGRISEHGNCFLCSTLIHSGPISGCVRDMAIIYDIVAGPDPDYPISLQQPPVQRCSSLGTPSSLKGLRIGIYKEHFEDADLEVVECCNKAIEELSQMGALVVPIEIPEMEEARVGLFASGLAEMVTLLSKERNQKSHLLNPEGRITITLASRMTAEDYLKAQQQRTRLIGFLKDIFKKVDCIVTPTTGITAPKIHPDTEECGESNVTLTGVLMKFALLGNYSGVPAVNVPVGYDSQDLPIGLQVMGRWWEERLLLHVAYAIESKVIKRRPALHYNILN